MKRTTPGAVGMIRVHVERDWKAPQPDGLWRRMVKRLMGVA